MKRLVGNRLSYSIIVATSLVAATTPALSARMALADAQDSRMILTAGTSPQFNRKRIKYRAGPAFMGNPE